MTAAQALEFMAAFWMPLTLGLASVIGAVLGVGFRDDSPHTDWPREDT